MPWMNSTIRAISVFFSPIPFSMPSQSNIFSGSQRKVVLIYFITEIVHCNTISWDIIIHSFMQRTNPKTQCVFVNCVLQCLQYFLSQNSICFPQTSLPIILDCVSVVFRASLQNPFYYCRKESFLFCTRHLDFPMKTLRYL